MKTLFFLILLITISSSYSRPNPTNGGFTLDLIHRDSPQSPLYNPTFVPLDRVHNAFLRSMSRASRLSNRAGLFTTNTSTIVADISGVMGEYLMLVKVGTPPVEVLGVADTGSDLTWAQCKPCESCYKQVGPPFLVPSNSSTYQVLSCQSKSCEALTEHESSCDSKNICHYKMGYGDNSYTKGDLAVDTFWFGSTPFKNVAFGCGHDNNGTFNEDGSGIIGLGGGSLSIISQLESVIQGRFSYCLIPYLKDTANQTSKIHFGSNANVIGTDVISTPLVKKNPSTFYYVTLESVFVGNNNTSSYKSYLEETVQEGNIIVDSGTTLTFIPREFYDDLTSGLSEAIGSGNVKDPQGYFEYCYKDLNLAQVPNVTFRFTGADVLLPPENIFLEMYKGVSCLTIVAADDFSIFGNLSQRNMLVGFDLVNHKVSFKSTDCTKHA